VEDPRGLTALGFVGISDPLRPGAAAAVARCRAAGVRVVMLTGDHPATARAIAREAGLPVGDEEMLTGEDVEGLDDETLAARLERATVIARTTPLQKVRIVDSLRGRGHVVAMTGDGVNDAPVLRLADVGVAAALSREGGSALDAPLRADIIRRGIATGGPSFGAYLLASRTVGMTAARSVAYLSIVMALAVNRSAPGSDLEVASAQV